jgi:hypothetical protein
MYIVYIYCVILPCYKLCNFILSFGSKYYIIFLIVFNVVLYFANHIIVVLQALYFAGAVINSTTVHTVLCYVVRIMY